MKAEGKRQVRVRLGASEAGGNRERVSVCVCEGKGEGIGGSKEVQQGESGFIIKTMRKRVTFNVRE